MELSLKDRKSINNGAIKLPKYEDGLTPNWKAWDGGPILSGNKLASNISGLGGVSITLDMLSPSLNIPTKLPDDIRTPERDALSRGTKIKPQAESSLKDAAGGIVLNGVQFIGAANKAFTYDKSSNQLLVDAGEVSRNVAGIATQMQNKIDAQRELDEVKKLNTQNTLGMAASGAALGGTIGSVIPGLGTAVGAVAGGLIGGITGLFGGAARRRKARRAIENAQIQGTEKNNYNADLAIGEAMKHDEAEAGYKNGKQPVYSPFGPTNAKQDSWANKGEEAIYMPTGQHFTIPTGPNDTARFAGGKDPNVAIVTTKYGLSDIARLDPYLAVALQGEFKKEGLLKKAAGELKAKNGKMPKRAEGWLPNAIVSGIGSLAGLNQYLDAKNSDIRTSNIYAPNTYASRALPGLASLRYNQYPVLNQIANQRAAYDYALNNSGGLSGALKYLGRIANANNMYRTSADLLTNLQERNIGLKLNYYNTMLNVGAQDAQRRMAANQYDLDYYSKAHAARQQGMQMGMYNMLNQLQQYYANDFKRRQFNDTLSLYREDLDLKKSELASMNKSLQAQIDALRKLNKGK